VSAEQERIDAQASDWIVRASEPTFTAAEARELAKWRAADPRHERSYQQLEQISDDIQHLTHLSPLGRTMPERGRVRTSWQTLRVLAAAIVMVVVAAVLYFSHSEPTRIATEIAELREVRLPDGSLVTLGPKSQLAFRFTSAERRVTLGGGAAFFEVTRDPSRPFIVDAGISSVRVVGTQFEVNKAGTSVRVAVLEGVVQVAAPGQAEGNSPAHTLHAGYRAEVDSHRGGPLRIDIEATSVQPGAWRQGWLAYDDATLGEVLADLSRYSTRRVTLADPALSTLRITAAFKASERDAFLSTLSGALPVRVTQASDGSFTLEPT
jgi:transmembrane sensor